MSRFEDFRLPKFTKCKYRYIKLRNNIKCMLVQDKESTKAAATLFVASGSFNDPPEAQGLAHFCEHMLFLGTKKYPEENTYSKFIQAHGGSKNAATGENYTYYYFTIQNEFFSQALDIFSEFFKEPLFTESATSREMNAVDNEFKKNLSNETRRMLQVMSEMTRESNPCHHFGTGNLQTLDKENIHELLLAYYEKYYSANQMCLCLVGNYSLDELEEMAIDKFATIKDKGISRRDFSLEAPIYKEDELGLIIKIVPIKNQKQLTIKWPELPVTDKMVLWRTRAMNYISHNIGHEGKNSLLSELIRQGLATTCDSGTSHRFQKSMPVFTLTINMTDKGVENVDAIIHLVFAYINRLKEQGP